MVESRSVSGVNIRESPAAIFMLLMIFVILPSPAFHQLTNIGVKGVFLLTILGIVMSCMLKNISCRFSKQTILLSILFLFISTFASILSNSTSQILMGLELVLMILLSKSVVQFAVTSISIKSAYYFTVILLVGAWIGFFYVMLGGGPLVCVNNPDTRESCLFLTTFSHSENIDFWRIIRPAGIYDEPGALSFFTILMVCLNELVGGGKKKSITLLFLGIITLSLAHIVCLVAYCFVNFKRKIVYYILVFGLLLGYAQIYTSDESLLYKSFFSRFVITDEGLKGDDRSISMKLFIETLDYDISRYGNIVMNRDGVGRPESVAKTQTANPFSIWFGYGFIMWIPYVVTLLMFMWHFFSRIPSVQLTSILMFLLLLQRPYIYSMYWGFAVWIVVSAMLLKKYAVAKYCVEAKICTKKRGSYCHDQISNKDFAVCD